MASPSIIQDLSNKDVPLSLFGGLNTELSPSDLPEGLSPDNQDVIYLPGSVSGRGCLHRILSPSLGSLRVMYEKTYVLPNGNPLNLILDSLGNFWKEDVNNSPGTVSLIGAVTPGVYAKSVTFNGVEYIAFSDGLHGVDAPRQYDGTNFDRVSQSGPGAGITSVADSGAAGSISAGVHQVVVSFLTRSGYITVPSNPQSWTAAGSKKVTLTGIPIGPPNVIARIISFTGAGGSNFFNIPATTTFPTSVTSTVIFDNTTTTLDLDFSDNALFAATGIDIPGNNLFAMATLGPVLGFFSYASRLFAWGERNTISNLLNMGFEGGYQSGSPNTPLGWTVVTAGGTLVTTGSVGQAWQIAGGAAGLQGEITQPAYTDFYGIQILLPSTAYTFRAWIKPSVALQGGSVTADIFSASQGVIATANIVVASASTSGTYLQATFSSATGTSIPADTVLRIYATGIIAGQSVTIDEMQMVYTARPFRDNTARASYVLNPESFDGVTGVIGPESDPSQLRDFGTIRNALYLHTADRLHSTNDVSDSEPSKWTVSEIGTDCGILSAFCSDSGEDWRVWASRSGLRIFEGGLPYKISQEIQSIWETINWSAQQTIWLVNDPNGRRVNIGIPTGGNTSPNIMLPMDYRELDAASQISASAPLHISFTGKMISSDMARKWTRWNLAMNCGAMIKRPNGVTQFSVGGNFGNIYYFDPTKLTDDDYGQVSPYYTTFFFVNHEAEIAMAVGCSAKLFSRLEAFISGTGAVTFTPLGDALTNGWTPTPALTLQAAPITDIDWGLNVIAERCAFKIASQPAAGQTDNSFNLQKLIITLKQNPIMPSRGV